MIDVVVHLTEIKPESTIASARIAKFVKETLNVDCLVDNRLDAETILVETKNIGTIYLVNGPPAFCQFREELAEMVRRCETLIFIQNDYTIYPPSQVNKVMRERGWVGEKGEVDPPQRWTTIPARMKKRADAYINWNCLTYKTGIRPNFNNRKSKLLYYGAFRQNRINSFIRFFSGNENKLAISGSGRAEKNFKLYFPDAEYIDPQLDIIEKCNQYKYGLYIEDDLSHKKFCSLANRFYEMLSAKMLIMVDAQALETFVQAEYPLASEFVVFDGDDVARIMRKRNWDKLVMKQQRMWAKLAQREHKMLAEKLRFLGATK